MKLWAKQTVFYSSKPAADEKTLPNDQEGLFYLSSFLPSSLRSASSARPAATQQQYNNPAAVRHNPASTAIQIPAMVFPPLFVFWFTDSIACSAGTMRRICYLGFFEKETILREAFFCFLIQRDLKRIQRRQL